MVLELERTEPLRRAAWSRRWTVGCALVAVASVAVIAGSNRIDSEVQPPVDADVPGFVVTAVD